MSIKEERERRKKPKRDVVGRPPKYPWDKMELGDVLNFDNQEYSEKFQRKISATVRSYAKRTGKKFVTRKVEAEDGTSYLCVFRTK